MRQGDGAASSAGTSRVFSDRQPIALGSGEGWRGGGRGRPRSCGLTRTRGLFGARFGRWPTRPTPPERDSEVGNWAPASLERDCRVGHRVPAGVSAVPGSPTALQTRKNASRSGGKIWFRTENVILCGKMMLHRAASDIPGGRLVPTRAPPRGPRRCGIYRCGDFGADRLAAEPTPRAAVVSRRRAEWPCWTRSEA